MVSTPTRMARNSEFQATPQRGAAGDAAEAPEPVAEQLADEDWRANRCRPAVIMALASICRIGMKMKSADDGDDEADRADDEDVAADGAARRQGRA